MRIKALTGFSGVITMAKGEVTDCDDLELCQDLIRAEFVEPVEDEPRTERKAERK